MVKKPKRSKKKENYTLANILVILIFLYLVSIPLPIVDIQQALIVSLFRLGLIALTLAFTIAFVMQKRHDSRRWMTGLFIVLILYIGSLFTVFISPYSKYPLYVIKCGARPIMANDFSKSYTLPSDSKFYRVDILTNHYYCTEREAKAAGFHQYPEHHD
ncbi:MAG TPA: hypothetical protein VFX84_02280 [Candidatus Saccharimonadales bacterium]|nr:hypothetical protein [Candidatus Saccharimonadales bacterium]